MSRQQAPSARLCNAWTSLSVFLFLLLLSFFDPDVLYDLENGNDLFPLVDIDHPVRKQNNKQYK